MNDFFCEAKKLIEESENIFILPSNNILNNAFGSCLALFYTLRKLNKKVNLLAEKIPEKFYFLTNLPYSSDFVISIDSSEKEISEIRYKKTKKTLQLYLVVKKGVLSEKDIYLNTPESSNFALVEPKDLSVFYQSSTSYEQNLLITLGIQSLRALTLLKKNFLQDAEIFSENPILNIDNHPLNENFGKVNLVKTDSFTLAEILTEFTKSIDQTLFDKSISTCLLSDIITSTQNFQNPKTNLKTLETASFLIKTGAELQKIYQELSLTHNTEKIKSFSQVQFLGHILKKLNLDEKKKLIWISLNNQDFKKSKTNSKDLGWVVKELKIHFGDAFSFLILWESYYNSKPLIKGLIYSPKSNLINTILKNFKGISETKKAIFFISDKNLNSAEKKVLKILA